MKTRVCLGWAACVVVALGSGCGSADHPGPTLPKDHIEYELFDSTRLLEPGEAESLAFAGEDGVLVFDPAPTSLEGLAVGDVLLAGASEAAPAGFLRVVLGVEREGGTLTIRTAAAPLQLAFRKLDVRIHREARLEDGAFQTGEEGLVLERRVDPLGIDGEVKRHFDILVFDGDGDPATTNDQVRILADLSGGFGFDFHLSFDWESILELPVAVTECLLAVITLDLDCSIEKLLPEARAEFRAKPKAGLDVRAIGAATMSFEREYVVGTVDLPPIVLFPLVFIPAIEIVATIEGGSSARFDVNVKGRADLESSVKLSTRALPEIVPLRVNDHEASASIDEVDLHAHVSAGIGPRLSLALYGVAGPFASARGEASVRAAPLDDPCWSLRFALAADLGVRVTTPDLPVIGYATLFEWTSPEFRPLDEEIARGSCVVPEHPPPPPGSGPDVHSFQSPTFTPWALVVGGEVDGTLADSVGSLASGDPTLLPSIDGSFVGAGAFLDSLHKIGQEGELIWQRKLLTERDEALRVIRVLSTKDARLLAMLKPKDTAAFVLARLSQAGEVLEAWSYHLPCVAVPHHLMHDEGNGYVALGSCRDTGQGWIVRTDGRGRVSGAWFIEEGNARSVTPTAGLVWDGEAAVVGKALEEAGGTWTFVFRMDEAAGTDRGLAWVCPERIATEPRFAIPSEEGGITVVGESNGPGFVARVRRDGALGFVHYPNLGTAVSDVFSVSTVAELPVTGMVIGASQGNVLDSKPNALVLAGLDGGGRTMWARRYFLDEAMPRSIAWPALRLTDDGGVFVTGIAAPSESRAGDLVAMKVFLKDGHLGEGTALRSEPIDLADHPCKAQTRPFVPQLHEAGATAHPMVLRRG